MSHEIVMPQLGLSMDSGEIIEWLKKQGEQIKTGDLLFQVESDKTIVEVEAVSDGILHIVKDASSGSIPVGDVVGLLLDDGESPPILQKPAVMDKTISAGGKQPPTDQVEVKKITPAALVDNNRPSNQRRLPSSPAARRRAKELGVDWQLATGSGPQGRIKVRDIEALAAQETEAVDINITPVARRQAEAIGLNLHTLAKKYPGQQIDRPLLEQHLLHILQDNGEPNQTALPPSTATHSEPLSSMRQLIAANMSGSHLQNAPVTLITEADAKQLINYRSTLKEEYNDETVPSFSAIFVKLAALALIKHPQLNASLDDNQVVYHDFANIGVAVDTERGLLVPVLQAAESKSLQNITLELNDLLKRAKQSKAKPEELQGGTFTITNLGPYEVDAFTPIINMPECAILGIGRIKEQVAAHKGEIAIRPMITLSLTFDHRLVDGAPAAAFLQQIKKYVENPYLWLM